MEPIDSKETIPPAYVQYSLAGRYDNPIPTRFLALIDRSKIPAVGQVSKLPYLCVKSVCNYGYLSFFSYSPPEICLFILF